MDSKANGRKPPRWINSLSKLPREVFHKVVLDLPLAKVLEILTYDDQYLKDGIISSSYYRAWHNQGALLGNVLGLFVLFRDICAYHHSSISQNWTYVVRTRYHSPDLTQIYRYIDQEIKGRLELHAIDENLLLSYSTTPLPKLFGYFYENGREGSQNRTSLLARWEWIKEAKANLNMAKAKQWEMAADLISESPGKYMLKKPLDFSQRGPRENMKHIENRFRGNAKRILKNHTFNHRKFQIQCAGYMDLIELVPYDKYLWLFLETVFKNPVKNESSIVDINNHLQNNSQNSNTPKSTSHEQPEALTNTLAEISLNESTTLSSTESTMRVTRSFPYPEHIVIDVKKVLAGLAYVYTGSPLLIIPRIDWTPEKPVFKIDHRDHENANKLPAGVHRCPVNRHKPYDEREYEWLKAFLRVVTWMEGMD